ncbi:hypothetical protein HTV80_13030 [Streptomyces sp. Vc74B-19]|uniref:hypothetical protein n=1 Tax=Streptomyces sp. Vc74B-19 TaxID=2741324 RepID=UPI001BFC4906|nr:hypothetical protein [Streptomyces sp. Vc74B-19]MBT3164034.1 hypothetical protein [Streptomyces sp. Vc74B-19]
MKALVAREPVPYSPTHGRFDLVKLQRVVDGRMPHTELSRDEKVYIACHFEGSARSIGRLLGVTEKTVTRWREDDQEPPEDGGGQ